MEKLVDHTLRKQLEKQSEQIAKLTTLVEQLAQSSCSGVVAQAATTIVNGSQTNTQSNFQINIMPWSSSEPVHVPVELVAAAFSENPKLREYCTAGDRVRLDAEASAPYVLEALLDIIKRAHIEPEQRNVYLSPKRADQVLVYVPSEVGKWKVVPLVEAIRRLFDGVSGQLHRLVLSDEERTKLPEDQQGAVGWVPIHYDTEPDKYVNGARKSLAAHLENNRRAQGS